MRASVVQDARPGKVFWLPVAYDRNDTMSWTETELAELRRAYASGTLRVSYDGKSVEYGTAADLLARIRTIEAEISSAAGRPKPRRSFAAFSKG